MRRKDGNRRQYNDGARGTTEEGANDAEVTVAPAINMDGTRTMAHDGEATGQDSTKTASAAGFVKTDDKSEQEASGGRRAQCTRKDDSRGQEVDEATTAGKTSCVDDVTEGNEVPRTVTEARQNVVMLDCDEVPDDSNERQSELSGTAETKDDKNTKKPKRRVTWAMDDVESRTNTTATEGEKVMPPAGAPRRTAVGNHPNRVWTEEGELPRTRTTE
ncbi:hypothetical protein GN958_ATG02916 [Phytophthora infestans]|uniref:Uncharacterized protein n=1 Tax=Phytophthora infestans TaxID=4787 RepID=A0A8S9V6W4_PHYIN|nr:hypothetical protein GN958_ATG14381 [Phytophthora infestans]KAF4147887.1 hypothetical protein GN958_ATG02916 [Phytophthora infestans]